MKIIIAKTAGFCMGVKRAVDLALENAGRSGPGGLRTLGPLIHNRSIVDMLRQRGVREFDEKESAAGPLVPLLIRAHGVPPAVQERYERAGHAIIDGTCPKVKTVHKVIKRYRTAGYRIVITGDPGHAEVVGLQGYAGGESLLVSSAADVDSLPRLDKACLVSQTTFDRSAFDRIAVRLRSRFPAADIVIKKTICAATDLRQAETETLARQVDALIVVGGRNSANTQRLAGIARESGTPTQLVETEQEIDWQAIASCKTVGVTAGASTPNWMITRVVDFISLMDRSQQLTVPNLVRRLFDLSADLNIFVSLGAVAAYYVSSHIQGCSFTGANGALPFLYFLSMYLWNSLTSIETTQHLGLSRFRFYSRNRPQLFSLAVASISVMLALGLVAGGRPFLLLLFATIAGSVYHVTIVPKPLRRFLRYKKLKDIPASRDLFVALAWGTVLTFLPQAIHGRLELNLLSGACFGWLFVLAFLRSLIFDLRDIEGDRIMGRETLITIVGDRRARRAMYLIICLCVILLAAAPALSGLELLRRNTAALFLSQIPALLYALLFVKWNPRLKSTLPALFNIMADGVFYLAGLGALFVSITVGR